MEVLSENNTENKYVVFRLENEFYGININTVKSIEKIQGITRIPNSPDYVKGVINLRGEVVPVLDLRVRFGLASKEYDSSSRIIILLINDLIIGVIVDSSSEVIQLTQEEIDKPPTVSNDNTEDFIMGLGKKDSRLVILLDLLKVLGSNEVQVGLEV